MCRSHSEALSARPDPVNGRGVARAAAPLVGLSPAHLLLETPQFGICQNGTAQAGRAGPEGNGANRQRGLGRLWRSAAEGSRETWLREELRVGCGGSAGAQVVARRPIRRKSTAHEKKDTEESHRGGV